VERGARRRLHPGDRGRRRLSIRRRAPLARRRVGELADAAAAEEPLRRRGGGRLGTQRAAEPRPRWRPARPRERNRANARGLDVEARPDARHRAPRDGRGSAAHRRERDPHDRLADRTDARASRPPPRSHPRKRTERGDRGHVGRTRDDARRRRALPAHGRGALGRGLARERAEPSRAPRGRRTLDVQALRRAQAQRAARRRREARGHFRPRRAAV
jgi:hypothetical protein